jgi:hypothetical protein
MVSYELWSMNYVNMSSARCLALPEDTGHFCLDGSLVRSPKRESPHMKTPSLLLTNQASTLPFCAVDAAILSLLTGPINMLWKQP